MDDTTWIAKSRADMEAILEDAREFYKANDSQVNSSKSVLITINNPKESPGVVHAGLNKEPVQELDQKEHARFLEV